MSDLGERALNHLVMLTGHFTRSVRIEVCEEISSGIFHLRVRHSSRVPDETQVTAAELDAALSGSTARERRLVAPHDLFLWAESQRIRLAYAHDPLFAVSLSGVRGLPHQIEAVYRRMLPQPRLRFVLADDPGSPYACSTPSTTAPSPSRRSNTSWPTSTHNRRRTTSPRASP